MTRYSDNSGNEMVTVSCTIERETPRAYLIETEDRADHWVPKSQCQRTAGGLKIKRWLIDKNNILVGHHQLIEESRPGDMDPDEDDPIDDGDRIPDEVYERDFSSRGSARYDDDIPF